MSLSTSHAARTAIRPRGPGSSEPLDACAASNSHRATRHQPVKGAIPLRVSQRIRLAVGVIVLLVVVSSVCGLVGLRRTVDAARESRAAAWSALATLEQVTPPADEGAPPVEADGVTVPTVADETAVNGLVEASRLADQAAEATFRQTQRAMSVLAILAVALGAILAVTLTRVVVRPLELLTEAFRRLGQGEAEVTIPGADRHDEFGAMAHAAQGVQQQTAQREAVLRRATEASAELARANDELHAFVQSVSHDLKAPLVTTTGFLEMAREVIDHGDARRAIELLDRTAASALRMDRLISDLQEVSLAGQDRPLEPVDLDQELRDVLVDLEPRFAAAGVELSIDVGLGYVPGDATRVRQVLANLLTNALKYGSTAAAPRVRVWGDTTDRGRRLLVSDNGAGIDSGDRERVFHLYERLPRHRASDVEGTGIGLALAQRAMEAMGGTVSAYETEGGGATFALQFARDEALCAAPC